MLRPAPLPPHGFRYIEILETEVEIRQLSLHGRFDPRPRYGTRQHNDLMACPGEEQCPIPPHTTFRTCVWLTGKGGKQNLQAIASSSGWKQDGTSIDKKRNDI